MPTWLRQLLCWHDWPRYFNSQGDGIDGIDRHHLYLWRHCTKCGKLQHAALHVPQLYVDAYNKTSQIAHGGGRGSRI